MRRAGLVQRMGLYRDLRISDQKKWYSDKSQNNRKTAWAFFTVTLIAMGMAIGVHFWRAVDTRWDYWPGDGLITIALGFLTWLQAKRYQELAETYSIAAQDISMVEIGLGGISNEFEFSIFVGDAENAFSREHTQWVARKDR